jgi:hypothetical protein
MAMLTRTSVLFGILAAAMFCLPTTTSWSGGKIQIVEVYAKEVDLYTDPTAAKKFDVKLQRGVVSPPLDVLEVSPNLMFRIKVGQYEGWIRSTMVKTTGTVFEIKDLGPCNYAGQSETGGSTRGIGNNCGSGD